MIGRAALAFLAAAGPAAALELQLPIDCAVGVDCFIQNYVDRDPGPGFVDYRCGGAGYDGHKGVDFALRGAGAMAAGVPALASAAGVVKSVRDGEPDDGRARPGRDCGNGVLIDHGAGWETQYCHLRQGSIAVRPGQRLAAGDRLGLIGQSGRADFPHVHLSVRHDGAVIDPFHGPGAAPAGCAAPVDPLWAASVAPALGYAPGWVNRLGLWSGAPDWAVIDRGETRPIAPDQPLVAYVEVRNLPKGWSVTIQLIAMDGGVVMAENTHTADRHRARQQLFAGRRTPPAAGWNAARFAARVALTDPDGRGAHQQFRVGAPSARP